jgi:hypothetical protein
MPAGKALQDAWLSVKIGELLCNVLFDKYQGLVVQNSIFTTLALKSILALSLT